MLSRSSTVRRSWPKKGTPTSETDTVERQIPGGGPAKLVPCSLIRAECVKKRTSVKLQTNMFGATQRYATVQRRSMMYLFVIAAGMMVVVHLVAAWERPRAAVIVSGILWLLYTVYEHQVATGVLCDADCNIRVDLVFFYPILGLATLCAYRSYEGRPGQMMIISSVLGAVGLLAFGLVLESYRYPAFEIVAALGALAIGTYAVLAKRRASRS
jgi:hypothetical protein